jgi:SAM-dependent methyltransferase
MMKQNWRSARRALRRLAWKLRRITHKTGSGLTLIEQASFDDYLASRNRSLADLAAREAVERDFLTGQREPFSVAGRCWVCGTRSDFAVDFAHARKIGEEWIPNWRESLLCRSCGLNNRLRASLHLFHAYCAPRARDSIYMTEQTTPIFRWLSESYTDVTGSEYLGDGVPFGQTDDSGIRNESLTRLSFPDAQFDHLLSFDVLEHIPNWQQALSECFRCLKPGGWMMLSVPFLAGAQETLIRAKLSESGAIEHILPPEYHGDPLTSDGCLCFYHFGWDLLTRMADAGFESVRAVSYWSRAYGYFGGEQFLFFARRP